MKRQPPPYDPIAYFAGSYLARWAKWQCIYREAVRRADDDLREEGRLLYSAPEAMV